MARPIKPPSASTSRTIWPLARPPIAGLHDIWPILPGSMLTNATIAPRRAAAHAASAPAWPPPMTMMSKLFRFIVPVRPMSLAHADASEHETEQGADEPEDDPAGRYRPKLTVRRPVRLPQEQATDDEQREGESCQRRSQRKTHCADYTPLRLFTV